jgi:hypothetical protein
MIENKNYCNTSKIINSKDDFYKDYVNKVLLPYDNPIQNFSNLLDKFFLNLKLEILKEINNKKIQNINSKLETTISKNNELLLKGSLDELEITQVKNNFKSMLTEYNLFNKIYREKDLQIITSNLNEPIKQADFNSLLETAIKNKDCLFGFYTPNQYKRVFLPYYIRVENIIEIIKLNITSQLTDEQLNVFIYNYNTFFYEIIIGDDTNKFFYIKENTYSISSNKNYFKIPINYIYDSSNSLIFTKYTEPNYIDRLNKPNISLPLQQQQDIKYIYIPITQKMNKIYDDIIKNILFEYNIIPKGIYLKTYNEKKFNIINISILNNKYNFTYKDKKNSEIKIELPLYDLIKNEKIPDIKLQIFYTDYNYSDVKKSNSSSFTNIHILTFYEDINKIKHENIFGTIQNQYNDYILFEQFKKKIKLNQPIYLEDIIITNNYFAEKIPEIFTKINNKLFNENNIFDSEIDYFYANEKSKEIIYKETKRKIVKLRFIAIILYIARIYSELNINYFKNYSNVKIEFNKFLSSTNNFMLETIFDNITNSIQTFFNENIGEKNSINKKFVSSIIDGSLFSNNKQLFIKKQNILETSIETATENIENIYSEMDKFMKMTTESSLNKIDPLKDTYTKISTNVMDYFNKEPDYTNESLNITDFEEKNFSLTSDVIKNRAKKWITGPIYNKYCNKDGEIKDDNTNICPDVIQFISEYLNNKSGSDLISIKNKEQICKNISSIKNTIEKNTTEIKYILPKTFFDDEQFMTKYSKFVNDPNDKLLL